MKPIESVLILPSQERILYPALAFIRTLAVSCGFSERDLNDIEVAAEEAIANVIKHGFEGHSDETFKLVVRFSEAGFAITLFERGVPFDPENCPRYEPGQLKNTLNTDGMGLFIMKETMDEVIFENLGRDGKSLSLVKHIADGHIKQILEKEGNSSLATPLPDSEGEVLPFEIRTFRPEDAPGISRCAYYAYGYTYVPFIYYPEKIAEMNRTGILCSYLATNKHSGEILGHVAFRFKKTTDRIAEACAAFVKPGNRKSGVFQALTLFTHEKALALHLFGIYVSAVTSHIGSQKVGESMGYLACGVLLGYLPADLDFKALTGKTRQKDAGLLLYRPILEVAQERVVYVPPRHGQKVVDLFRTLGIRVTCGTGEETPSAMPSEIQVQMVPILNIADIEVHHVGSDILHELNSLLHGLCVKHVDAIFIHIDIEDPNALFLADQSERLGFFFSGILPFGLNSRHKLILQFMNNLSLDFDLINPIAPSSIEMLDYVRSCFRKTNSGDTIPTY